MGDGVGRTNADEDYTPLVPQVRIRVGVECATVQQFVADYCRFVDGDRIFLATEAVEVPGSLVQFRVDLSDGRAALHGTGTVIEARGLDGVGPRGMLLRFVALDEGSARVVEAMGERRARSTPSVGVPTLKSARHWHTQSIERDRIVPANPFGDVPDSAIVYFVDWSIERNNGTTLRRGPAAVAYHAVRMEAPRRQRRRFPAWVPFSIGLVTGGIAIVAVFHAWQELGRAFTPPGAVTSPFTPPPRAEPAPPMAVRSPSTTTASRSPTMTMPSATKSAAPRTTPLASAASAAPRTTPLAPATTPTVAAATPAPSPATGDAPLAIASSPPATVRLDGAAVGRTPLTLRVRAGAHVVELERPRYQTARIDVDAPGSAGVRLERPRATVHVTSNVAGAEVFVDDDLIGLAPISAEVAGFERCTVEVRAPGGRRWHKRIYVKPPLIDLAATFAE